MNTVSKFLLLPLLFVAALHAQTPFEPYFSKSACDKVIDKKVLTICYDCGLKAAKAVAYTLRGDRVKKSIKKRPRFYPEPSLRASCRAEYKDYTHSGYDRGHLASDASFDWSPTSLNQTYSLANIVPQASMINRKLWVKAEKYERYVAIKLERVEVLNIVVYPRHPKRIGENGIAVPSGFWKKIENRADGFERCFYYENNLHASAKGDKLKAHVRPCDMMPGPKGF